MISTLIKTVTASDATSIDFVDGTSDVVLDGTYDHYMFVMTDINPATDRAFFTFQVNATDDPGGGFDTSLITSTAFYNYHLEDDSAPEFGYLVNEDQAQSANFVYLQDALGNDADACCVGTLHLFNPSSTAYVKHFSWRGNAYRRNDGTVNFHVAGYINDTTAIDEIRFKMSTGNLDGTIQLYGIA